MTNARTRYIKAFPQREEDNPLFPPSSFSEYKMTNKERQVRKRLKKKEMGMQRIELWIFPEWKQLIKEFIEKLKG